MENAFKSAERIMAGDVLAPNRICCANIIPENALITGNG